MELAILAGIGGPLADHPAGILRGRNEARDPFVDDPGAHAATGPLPVGGVEVSRVRRIVMALSADCRVNPFRCCRFLCGLRWSRGNSSRQPEWRPDWPPGKAPLRPRHEAWPWKSRSSSRRLPPDRWR